MLGEYLFKLWGISYSEICIFDASGRFRVFWKLPGNRISADCEGRLIWAGGSNFGYATKLVHFCAQPKTKRNRNSDFVYLGRSPIFGNLTSAAYLPPKINSPLTVPRVKELYIPGPFFKATTRFCQEKGLVLCFVSSDPTFWSFFPQKQSFPNLGSGRKVAKSWVERQKPCI